jgi:DNA-binding transcriptional regulator PaaX
MHNSTTLLPEIMTPASVMALLDICRSTLTRMQRRGDIVAYKFGRRTYYRRSEILEKMTANRVQVEQVESTKAA